MKISVIIPTFGRSKEVVQNTIDSIFNESSNLIFIKEVIVIDQNFPRLSLNTPRPEVSLVLLNAHETPHNQSAQCALVHVYGISPSVTAAKNFGISVSSGEFLVFFDDDVTVHPGTIKNFQNLLLLHPQAGFFGGREVVDSNLVTRSVFKDFFKNCISFLMPSTSEEKKYKINGKYVGRIFSNSIMVSDYSLQAEDLVLIDGARGCIWAAKKSKVLEAGGFDPAFKGTALREETDLYFRIKKNHPICYFTSQSAVTHHRQLGGCDNLAVSFSRLLSKFENELLFQKKHFSHRSAFFFFVRLSPLALGALRETYGISLIFWLVFSCKAISLPAEN